MVSDQKTALSTYWPTGYCNRSLAVILIYLFRRMLNIFFKLPTYLAFMVIFHIITQCVLQNKKNRSPFLTTIKDSGKWLKEIQTRQCGFLVPKGNRRLQRMG
jgi:hypothetical protein